MSKELWCITAIDKKVVDLYIYKLTLKDHSRYIELQKADLSRQEDLIGIT